MAEEEELHAAVTRAVRMMMLLHAEDREDVAAVLGVGPQAVTDRMGGRVHWSLSDLAKLADHWRVRPGDLFRPDSFVRRPYSPYRKNLEEGYGQYHWWW